MFMRCFAQSGIIRTFPCFLLGFVCFLVWFCFGKGYKVIDKGLYFEPFSIRTLAA